MNDSPKVAVEIDRYGQIKKIDVSGTVGDECIKLTQGLKDGLQGNATVTLDEDKPELHMVNTQTNNVMNYN